MIVRHILRYPPPPNTVPSNMIVVYCDRDAQPKSSGQFFMAGIFLKIQFTAAARGFSCLSIPRGLSQLSAGAISRNLLCISCRKFYLLFKKHHGGPQARIWEGGGLLPHTPDPQFLAHNLFTGATPNARYRSRPPPPKFWIRSWWCNMKT